MYLQSTVRKSPLVSFGWIEIGSLTSPLPVPEVFVTRMVAGGRSHVGVNAVAVAGLNVFESAAVPTVALVRVSRWSAPHPESSTSDARMIGVVPTSVRACAYVS